MRSLLRVLAFLGPILGIGCQGPFEVSLSPDAMLRTDRAEYTLARVRGRMEVAIPFTYENRTGGSVYLVNCNGYVGPYLERRVGGEWRREWGAPENDCLSPAIGIDAGQTYRDTLLVYALPHGSNSYPQFRSADIAGVYRLRWDRALRSFDPRARPFGDELPLEQRISNEFVLEGP